MTIKKELMFINTQSLEISFGILILIFWFISNEYDYTCNIHNSSVKIALKLFMLRISYFPHFPSHTNFKIMSIIKKREKKNFEVFFSCLYLFVVGCERKFVKSS